MADYWDRIELLSRSWVARTDQELKYLYDDCVFELRNNFNTPDEEWLRPIRHMKYAAWFEINRRKKVKTHFLCYFEDHVSTFRMFEPRLAKTICNYAC